MVLQEIITYEDWSALRKDTYSSPKIAVLVLDTHMKDTNLHADRPAPVYGFSSVTVKNEPARDISIT